MQSVSRQSLAGLRAELEQLTGRRRRPDLAAVADQLFAVTRLLHEQPRLRRTLSDPALASAARAGIVDRLLSERVDRPVAELVRDAVGQRWAAPVDLVDAVEALAVQAASMRAERDDALDDVEDELFRFSRIVDREHGLRAALTDRGLPLDRKQELLHALLAAKVHPATLQLVDNLVASLRGRTLDRGLDEYARLVAARSEQTAAYVRVASPLSDRQARRLAGTLRRLLGRPVALRVEVDPGLVGGAVVRVGEQVLDGSVRRRLQLARRHLTGAS